MANTVGALLKQGVKIMVSVCGSGKLGWCLIKSGSRETGFCMCEWQTLSALLKQRVERLVSLCEWQTLSVLLKQGVGRLVFVCVSGKHCWFLIKAGSRETGFCMSDSWTW